MPTENGAIMFAARTNHLRTRQGHDHSRVTNVELFFDLVFVFAVTQLSHGLLEHRTPLGAMQIGIRTANTASSTPVAISANGGSNGPPDISNLSPRDRADRLYDRMMRLHEERKTDSVSFFAPMALQAYAAIPDQDAHTRYDMARIAMVAGTLPVAQAQADTILRGDSTHLLGLILAADLARAANDMAKATKLEATLLAQLARERARNLPEYQAHDREITSVVERLQGKR